VKIKISQKVIFLFILLLISLGFILSLYFFKSQKKALLSEFDARATADDTNEALIIGVTDAGSSGVFMRWSATIRIRALTFTTP